MELRAAGWVTIEDEGFIALVGPIWSRADGELHYCFVAEAKHRNERGVVQGGMLMTFADRTLAHAVRSANPDRPQATVQLDMHFLDGARIGDLLEARCRIVRRTKSLVFVEGDIFVGARIVASAKGIWKIMSPAT